MPEVRTSTNGKRPGSASAALAHLPERLDEEAVTALDQAAQSEPFKLDLLRSAPARDMRLKIEQVVALLEKMDAGRMLARQGPISRLTGADVEARLEFELAGQRVLAAIAELRRAAGNGHHIRALLAQGRDELTGEQARLEAVIAEARLLLAATRDADEFVQARFERRLSNIMAMHAANLLTFDQIKLAEDVLTGLLDRFTDVETLLLPLWQRNVIALAHAATGRPQKQAAGAFEQVNDKLIVHLKQETG